MAKFVSVWIAFALVGDIGVQIYAGFGHPLSRAWRSAIALMVAVIPAYLVALALPDERAAFVFMFALAIVATVLAVIARQVALRVDATGRWGRLVKALRTLKFDAGGAAG